MFGQWTFARSSEWKICREAPHGDWRRRKVAEKWMIFGSKCLKMNRFCCWSSSSFEILRYLELCCSDNWQIKLNWSSENLNEMMRNWRSLYVDLLPYILSIEKLKKKHTEICERDIIQQRSACVMISSPCRELCLKWLTSRYHREHPKKEEENN